jgi:hypothetical protein
MKGSCEHGNEPSGSIKILGNSSVTAKLAASQEGLSPMQLVFELFGFSFLIYVHVLHRSDYCKAYVLFP